MFQPDKITRLAINVFQEEGQISISGQGTLKRMFLSAHLSDNKQELRPPREHFYFNRNIHTPFDGTLVRKVSTYFILSQDEAEASVRQWEEWIVARSIESQVRFGEYGVFQCDEQLDFISESLYMYEWLPSIQYHHTGVPYQELGVEKKLQPVPAMPYTRKSRRKILVPLLWSVLGALFAFAVFLWSEPINLLIDQNTELNTRLVNVAPESYSIQDEVAYFNDTHGVRSSDAPTTNPKGAKPVQADKGSDNTNAGLTDSGLYEDSGYPHGEDGAIRNKVEDSAKPSDVSKRCTLIVGAFANPENVDRMVETLSGFDVKVVTMKRRTLTLVGADVVCSDGNQIATLKQQIEPNAWVYQK